LPPETETAEETEKGINTGTTEETGETGHDFVVIKIENSRCLRFHRCPRVTIPFPPSPRLSTLKIARRLSWYGVSCAHDDSVAQ